MLATKAFQEGTNWELEKVLIDNIVFNLPFGERRFLIIALAMAVVVNPIISLVYSIRFMQLPKMLAGLQAWFLIFCDLVLFGSLTYYIARSIRLRTAFGMKFENDGEFRNKVIAHLTLANNVKILPRHTINLNDRLIAQHQNLKREELEEVINQYWNGVGRSAPEWTDELGSADGLKGDADLTASNPLWEVAYRILIAGRWLIRALLIFTVVVSISEGKIGVAVLLVPVAVAVDLAVSWIFVEPFRRFLYGKR